MENKKISIKNFRVFKDYTEFELKPITILTGTNSSGKSSVFKALKLLKNNSENIETLRFNNEDLYTLGGFSNIISKYSKEKDLYFKTNFKNDLLGELIVEIIYEKNKESQKDEGIIKKLTIHNVQNKKLLELKKVKNQNTFSGKNYNYNKKYYNHDIWVDAFFSMLKRIDDYWKYIRPIEEKLNFRVELNEKEKEIVKKLEEKGYTFPEGYDRVVVEGNDTFLQQEECFRDKNGNPYFNYELNELLINTSTFFFFGFYEQLLNFLHEINNYNVNFCDVNLFSIEDDEIKYLVSELCENGIDNLKKLEELINESTKDYIKKHHLKESSCSSLSGPCRSSDFIDEFIKYSIIKNGFVQPHFLKKIESKNKFLQNKMQNENKYKSYLVELNKFFSNKIDRVLKDAINAFDFNYLFIDTDRTDLQRIFLYNNKSKFFKIINRYLEINKHNEQLKFFNKWIKEFEIADEIIFEPDEDGAGIKIFLLNGKEKTLLADTGFGINMLVPLIISLATYGKQYVFIEEPEANLHPSFQSKLAELFVDAYNIFGTKSVIETHSEYLIRKLQILIADKKTNISAEDINIYYLYHPMKKPEGAQQIYLMKIRDDGIMMNSFGKGFFDESSNLVVELLKHKN